MRISIYLCVRKKKAVQFFLRWRNMSNDALSSCLVMTVFHAADRWVSTCRRVLWTLICWELLLINSVDSDTARGARDEELNGVCKRHWSLIQHQWHSELFNDNEILRRLLISKFHKSSGMSLCDCWYRRMGHAHDFVLHNKLFSLVNFNLYTLINIYTCIYWVFFLNTYHWKSLHTRQSNC